MKLPIIKLLIGIFILTFVGIKYEPEFSDVDFFVKHKPNLKFEYYSPIGESDLTIEELSEKGRYEELMYREFVGNYYARDFLDNTSLFIIPLVTFLICSALLGLLNLIQNQKIGKPLHSDI